MFLCGRVHLALSAALQCTPSPASKWQYLTRLISEAEAYLTSVERLTQFEVSTPMEKSINGDGDTNGSSVEGSAVIPAKALPLGPKQRIVAEWEAEEARKIDG